MTPLRITWINKPGGSHNPNTHIIEVGGDGWRKSAKDVVNDIESNLQVYIVHTGAALVGVEVGIRNGFYYLKTRPDGTPLDNLLSLTNIAIR